MVWLSRLIASVLLSLIAIAVLAQVFDNTLLNSQFINKEAVKANIYPQLSDSLSNELVKDMGKNSNSSISEAQALSDVKSVMTPVYLQSVVAPTLNSVQAYYKGNGPVPTIDLTNVPAKLQAAGIPITLNGNNPFSKPYTFPTNAKVKSYVKEFETIKWLITFVVIGLLALLIFLSWEEHRWRIVPDLAIIEGILLGVIAAVFLYGVRIADIYGKINNNNNQFVGVANNFAKQITHDIGLIFVWIVVVLLILGIGFRILVGMKNKLPAKKVVTKSPTTKAPLKTSLKTTK